MSCFPSFCHQLTSTCINTPPITIDELSVLQAKTNSFTCVLNPIPFHLHKVQFYQFTSLSPTSSIFSSLLGQHIRIQIACCYFSHLKKSFLILYCLPIITTTHFFPIPSSNSLLNPLQSDFHLHDFTKTTLVNITKDLCLDSSGHLSVLIVSDLPETFDSEYHFLLKIFAVVGLQDSILSWSSSTSLAIIPSALYSFSTLISLGFPCGPRLND